MDDKTNNERGITMLPMSAIEINNGQLKGLPKNPRLVKNAKYNKLKESITNYPEMLAWRSLLVYPLDNGKYIIVGGNMRYRAMKELGHNEAPVFIIPKETPIEKIKAYTILDNNGFGEWDWDLLANEWDADMLDDWGLDIPTVEEKKKEAKDDGFSEDDGIERLVQPGDVWQLGRHRLICGDSTKAETYQRLMNGDVADLTFTSPPYNAATTATEAKSKKKSKYLNDDDNRADDEYTDLLCQFTKQCLTHSQYVFVNIQSLSNNKLSLIDYLYCMKKYYADTIIWDKQHAQPAMAKNVLNSQFEYIHIFSNKANRAIGVKEFRCTIPNVLNLPAQHKNEYSEIHNATFPVELVEFAVDNFCNNSILEPFGGTGTTPIVCEQLGKTCFTIELQPHYCDLIIARWQLLTGEKAVKVE